MRKLLSLIHGNIWHSANELLVIVNSKEFNKEMAIARINEIFKELEKI